MILKDSKGNTYAVHFLHSSKPASELGPYGSITDKGLPIRFTACTVHAGKCAKADRPCDTPGAVIAYAWCAPVDQFNRHKGRKLAFARAIEGFSKELRRELWQDFFRATGTKYRADSFPAETSTKESTNGVVGYQQSAPLKEAIARREGQSKGD